MTQNGVEIPERGGQVRLGRTEHRHGRHAEEGGQVHGAGVIAQQRVATGQFVHQCVEAGLPDTVAHGERAFPDDDFARGGVARHAEKNPVSRGAFLENTHGGGEAFGRPAFGRTVFRARADADFRPASRGPAPRGAGEGRKTFALRCAAMENEAHEAVGMVSAGVGRERGLLAEQPGTPVSRIADDTRNTEGACLEGGTQGVGKKDGRVESPAQPPREGARVFPGFDGNDLVDRGDAAPERGEFGRTKDGELQVGPAFFAGFDRGDAHDCVAQPIARPYDKAEGIECRDRNFRRKMVTALEPSSAEETGHGGFPTVVHPEPVGRTGGDLLFEPDVEQPGELGHGPAGGGEGRFDDTAPARRADRVDRNGNDRCIGADGQGGGEGRRRGEFAEERRPDARVPRVLIDEDGQHAAAADHFGRPDVAVTTAEGFHAEASAVPVDQAVDVFVALRLENNADGVFADVADELGVKFPVADVVDGHDHTASAGQGFPEEIEAVHFHAGLHVLLGHAGEAGGAEDVGPELAEMPAHRAADFAGRHGPPEGDLHIAPRQAAVAGEQSPGGESQKPAETENKSEGQAPENREQGEHEQIKGVIHGKEREN